MNSHKVLLVGWDAADWKVIRPLMKAGEMPNVQRLVDNGVSGNIATLHPPLSPMLWTSIATGKRPFKHGILGFSEPTPDGLGVQPVTNLSRTSKALWNILNQVGLRSVVIGWWPSHPAESINGVMVSDHFHRASGPFDKGWPMCANAIHPPELAGALTELRVHPDQLTPAMVEPFIPLAKEIDQDKDKRLALFLRTLAECMSIQAAGLWLMDREPWDFFTVYFDAIDHFCHGFMKYHPPRQSWISEVDYELYSHVVSEAYRFHDRMLGDLLAKAGPDTTVILVSDHGFHPDHLRPASIPDIPAGPAIEHRDFGVLAIAGPGITNGRALYGASVLDIAPTILTLYGLSVGEDFDGKVLSTAFESPPAVAFIPSWEEVPGADGRHPPHTRLNPVAAQEALEQLIALGYIERPDESREAAVEKTIRELRYNLGEAYQDAARHIEAREIFSMLQAADPDEQRFALRLFVSCQALGMPEEMRIIIADLERRGRDQAVLGYLKAQLLTAEKRYTEALECLSGPSLQSADLYLRLRRWSDARLVYESLLEVDPDNVHSHLGICRLALRNREFGAAAQSALDALERNYHWPPAHYLLGRALTGMKKYEQACSAFRVAISMNPNYAEAHIRLAALLEKHLSDAASAREHRLLARRMRKRTLTQRPSVAEPVAVAVATDLPQPAAVFEMPPMQECLIVVTGLPRSGTSLLMQVLAAGGLRVVSDGLRAPDEDNPRGYLEYEPVKGLLKDSKWLLEERGRAIKIVAPLLAALPEDLPCRVILSERDLEEVLDSQERMLARRAHASASTPERRRILKEEYSRTLSRVKAMIARRPGTQLLVIEHGQAISDPASTAEKINMFLGGRLDEAKMAAAIDPALHRNHASPAVF